MKKQIIAGITIIACVSMNAVVWPRSAEDKVMPVTQEQTTISTNSSNTGRIAVCHFLFRYAVTRSSGN